MRSYPQNRFAAIPAIMITVLMSGSPASAQVDDNIRGVGSEQIGDLKYGIKRTEFNPYIEIDQSIVYDGSNVGLDNSINANTRLAAGLNAAILRRSLRGQINLRYEHRFNYSQSNLGDDDIVQGLGKAEIDLLDNFLTLDVGGIANVSDLGSRSISVLGNVPRLESRSRVYGAYGGPTIGKRVNDIDFSAGYRIGYTYFDEDFSDDLAVDDRRFDTSENTFNQSADITIGRRARVDALPFGFALSGGWEREKSERFDQIYRSYTGTAEITVPVTRTLSLIGSVGYEDIQVTEAPALLDGNGDLVFDVENRPVIDDDIPRLISYDEVGVIYDAGLLWQPNRESRVEIRAGRRFGRTIVEGRIDYNPNPTTRITFQRTDTVRGVGNQISSSLANIGTNFLLDRDPITGSIIGCLPGADRDLCIDQLLQIQPASITRSRGFSGRVAFEGQRTYLTISGGYLRRSYLVSLQGGLRDLADRTDDYGFVNIAYARNISRDTVVRLSAFGNYFNGALSTDLDNYSVGATISARHSLGRRLHATGAVRVEQNIIEQIDDSLRIYALLGLRLDL